MSLDDLSPEDIAKMESDRIDMQRAWKGLRDDLKEAGIAPEIFHAVTDIILKNDGEIKIAGWDMRGSVSFG